MKQVQQQEEPWPLQQVNTVLARTLLACITTDLGMHQHWMYCLLHV